MAGIGAEWLGRGWPEADIRFARIRLPLQSVPSPWGSRQHDTRNVARDYGPCLVDWRVDRLGISASAAQPRASSHQTQSQRNWWRKNM